MAEPPSDPAFEIYRGLSSYEDRFNTSQAEIKKLASAWMLLTFTAIAYVVRGELKADKMLIDSAPLLAVIALGSNVGLVSLWIVDQLVYQRLLSAVFDIGLKLEERHPEWPPLRSLMWVKSKSRGMARHHALFYAAPVLLNCSVATYALFAMGGGRSALVATCAVISVFLLLSVLRDWITPMGLERDQQEKTRQIQEVVERWEGG